LNKHETRGVNSKKIKEIDVQEKIKIEETEKSNINVRS